MNTDGDRRSTKTNLDLTIPTAKKEEFAKIRRAFSVLRLVKLKIINNEVGFWSQSRLLFFFALAFSGTLAVIVLSDQG